MDENIKNEAPETKADASGENTVPQVTETDGICAEEDASGTVSEEKELALAEAKSAPDAPSVPKERIDVIGVRFKKQGKVYYFDPDGVTVTKDSHVIVDTSRGLEYGLVSMENTAVPAHEVVQPLRKMVRIATFADETHHQSNVEKETDAFNICLEKIEEHKLEMKLVDVEYTFDNSKLLFYYTAEGRIDFRELVKSLASVFHTRIQMCQIGIRDEAKMMGGLGVCGRPFCCASFLNDFVQVSIKMAKEQNLSLNSTKISGACGRLMCCLRYEYDAYQEEIALTPKVDAVVTTPDGDGVVTEISPLRGLCKVRLVKEYDQPPKLYRRDDLKATGKTRRDLPPIPEKQPDRYEHPERSKRIRQKPIRRESLDAEMPEQLPPVFGTPETRYAPAARKAASSAEVPQPSSASSQPQKSGYNRPLRRRQNNGDKFNSRPPRDSRQTVPQNRFMGKFVPKASSDDSKPKPKE